MPLINFLTRIHFADGVLEEALRSEMERMDRRRPLIVARKKHINGSIGLSVYSSFAIRTKIETFSDIPAIVSERAADRVAETYASGDHDLIIAFGGNAAIDLAKVARLAIARQAPVGQLTCETGQQPSESCNQPDLIAIPDISGFSSSVSDYSPLRRADGKQAVLQTLKIVPDVVICDPTVTLGSSKAIGASAAAGVVVRGVSAYFANGFNPPADGLALDSLSRIASNIAAALNNDELAARREMMAGSLNSALSMQKGLCAVDAVTSALASASGKEIDFGAAGRLLLPYLVDLYSHGQSARCGALKRSLMIDEDVELSAGLKKILGSLPLPDSLSQMGIKRTALKGVAELACLNRAIRNGPRKIRQPEVLSMLEAVY